MSDVPLQPGNSFDATERRLYPRHQAKSLAYLDIGPDNGGIVVNISEGGIAVQAVVPLSEEPFIGLRIQLPRSVKRLETSGKIAWTSKSKKEAGLEFVDLPEAARLEIMEWLLSEGSLQSLQIGDAPPGGIAPPPNRKRTDKWTNLVAELEAQGGATVARRRDETPPTAFVAPAPPAITAAEPKLPVSADAGFLSSEMIVESEIKPISESTLAAATEKMPTEIRDNSSLPTEPGVDPSAVAAETSPSVDAILRTDNIELALPSDRLLPKAAEFGTIAFPEIAESNVAQEPRSVEDSSLSASRSKLFLMKARSIFGSKSATNSNVPSDDAISILKSAPEMGPDPATGAFQAPPSLAAQSPPIAPMGPPDAVQPRSVHPRPALARPIASDRAGHASNARSKFWLSALELQLRSPIGILALCVTIAALCIGIGIVVGRGTLKGTSNVAASGDRAPREETAKRTAASIEPAPAAPAGQKYHDRVSRVPSPIVHKTSSHVPNRYSGAPSDEQPAPAPPDSNSSSQAASGLATSPSVVTPPEPSGAASRAATSIPAGSAPRTQAPSERVVPSHVVYRVEPFYPKEALQQRVEGIVRIHATVGQDGRVKNLRVVSGPALLTAAALDAAQYWRYIPALRNGEPIETEEDILVEFHLSH